MNSLSANNKKSSTLAKQLSIILFLLVVFEVFDYITGPTLDISITYFIPIVYTSCYIGRRFGWVVSLIASLFYAVDMAKQVRMNEIHTAIAISNWFVRLSVYLFVAEVTYRLAIALEQVRNATEKLQAAHDALQISYKKLDDDINAAGLLQETILSLEPVSCDGYEVGTFYAICRANRRRFC